MSSADPPTRYCYCATFDDKPSIRRDLGIPPGYCGHCDVEVDGGTCGRPGHMMGGNGPYTISRCDQHEQGEPIHVGAWLLGAIVIVIAIVALLLWL